ncbi:MAG: histidine kinase [Rhizonema sp. NSF051]|nr:histidine kinase [Rhizonema sp. NSF051]
MLKHDYMLVSQNQLIDSDAVLQLLLFVDGRPKSKQQKQQILSYLKELQAEYQFELQIIDVEQQPYLAEHFKLIATPALIKIHPEPRQVLAGSNIVAQLKNWWPRWLSAVDAYIEIQSSLHEDVEDNNRLSKSKSSIRSVDVSTELIKLSDEVFRLRQEKEKLQEQLKFKDRAIAMLAHDLRNPLTSIGIAMETLQSNYNVAKGEFYPRLTPTITVNLFKQARSQTKVMDRMIADLLPMGHGSDKEILIIPQKMELGKLCLDLLEELRDQYTAKSLNIEQDIPNDLPCVYGDPERIRQVLVNLLDNAIKYTPSGGTISISGFHRTTQKVQFSISDTGPGIPEENRERIFENHFRLKRDEATQGYGIGLCLCQRVIRAHYGQIWVDSNSNNGALFHFTLPVYPN